MTARIVTLTLNPVIDKNSAVGTVASEIKLRCDSPSLDPGGGGINVSRAIKKLGGESTAVYTAGGPNGDVLDSLLDREGLEHRAISINGSTRESFTVFEKSTTLQFRFNFPGPALTEAEWRRCMTILFEIEAEYIVASGSLPPGVPEDFYAMIATEGARLRRKVIIDTSGKALEFTARAGAFLLKPNLAELEHLSGKPFGGEHALKAEGQALVRDGFAEVLVVSMGAGGAALITRDEYVHLHAPVVPIQSKVGAGDSMVGGITLALAQGKSLLDAVRYGIAAGTAAVMTPGTQLCRKEDTDHLVELIQIKTS